MNKVSYAPVLHYSITSDSLSRSSCAGVGLTVGPITSDASLQCTSCRRCLAVAIIRIGEFGDKDPFGFDCAPSQHWKHQKNEEN